MSKALDITPSNHPLVVETENTIIMMSNVYQKEDLSCINKEGCLFDNTIVGINHMNLSRYMNIGTNYRLGERDKRFGIIADPYIPNRFYFVINNHHSNVSTDRSYLIFAEENDDYDINILGNVNTANIEWREILDIDENNIYVSGIYLYSGGIYVYKINKTTMTIAQTIFGVTDTNRGKCNLINKDETYLYFIIGGIQNSNVYGRFYFTRYNKNNGEVKNTIYTPPMVSAGNTNYVWNSDSLWMYSHTVDIEDFYEENGKYYWCYPQKSGAKFAGKEGNANNNLMIMCYDSLKAYDEQDVITFRTTNDLQDIESLQWKKGAYFAYRFWIIDGYLYYAIYDETNSDADMKNIQGIHVLKINPGFNLEYITKIQITKSKNIISMIGNSTKQVLLIGYFNSFEIYVYNKETHLYEKVNKEIPNIVCAGFDSMDRLWYENTNYGVFVENLDDPQEVKIKFEKLYYTYENTDIETYITFEATGFTDKIPTGEYILTLSGNAIFKGNHKKQISLNYTGGQVKVDIIINGPKRVTCSTKFKKVW